MGWNILAPLLIYSSTYEGWVIDEGTGDPIAGAVVVVIWYDSQIIHLAQTKYFQTASETLTEKDGTFSLWNWPGINLNPFTYVFTPPDVIIYKAGFATFHSTTEFTGTVNKLRKLKTKDEAMYFANRPAGDVPDYLVPKLISEVKNHHKNIGLAN